MKKSLVAAAGASLAAAALPAVGVFAATSQVIDTVRVTINDSCTIVNENVDGTSTSEVGSNGQIVRNTYTVSMSLGQLKQGIGGPGADGGSGSSTTGGQVKVVCNGSTAASISDSASGAGSWKLSAQASDGGDMVGQTNSANKIVTGTATSGVISNWAFKIDGTSGGSAYDGQYKDYSAIPSASDTELFRGTGEFTFKPRYQVYIGTRQAADTYTGTVTYTLTAPAD